MTDKNASELYQEKVAADPVLNNAVGMAFWYVLAIGFVFGAAAGCGIGGLIAMVLK